MNEKIKLKNKDILICKSLKRAEAIQDRMLGLMFKKKIHDGFDGLLLKPCKSIHTFFMTFPIDVLFLDKKMNVVKIIRNMKPWRVSGYYFKAEQVLELYGKTIPKELNVGDQLEVICTK